jgi:ABC-type glycerol-3-phosphate transport system substrate-binding protein
MNMKYKVWVVLLTTPLLILSLVACNSQQAEIGFAGDSAESSSATTKSPVKLRIYWWGFQARHDVTLKALDLYTKKNRHVTFAPEFADLGSYWDKLDVQFSLHNAPDIIQMDTQYLNDYSSRNLLADVGDIHTLDIDKNLLEAGKINGKLHAVPLGNDTLGFVYDKVALEKYGITPPADGWTWADFFSFVEGAKDKIGKDKYVFADAPLLAYNQYQTYQFSKDKGNLYTNDGKFNIDKGTWMDWCTKVVWMRNKGYLVPASVAVTDKELDPNDDLMVKGIVLMRTLYASQATSLEVLKPGAYAFVTSPKDKASGSWLKPSMFWSVNVGSKHIQESKKFIDWFINDPEVADILGTTRGVPASQKIVDLLKPKFTVADKMGADIIEKNARKAQPFAAGPKEWSNFSFKDFTEIYEKMIFGILTPEQSYEQLMKAGKQYEAVK